MKRKILVVVIALVLALSLLGSVQAAEKIRVGVIRITPEMPLFVALQKGYFKDEGIELEAVTMAGGATIMPAISGGSLEAGHSSVVSFLQAAARGFDFVLITGGSFISPVTGTILVKKESDIKTIKDLAGKKVSVNAVKSVAWLHIREAVRKAGGNPDTIQWFELPFPQMGPALLSGQVDAVQPSEPFITVLSQDPKARQIGETFHSVNPRGILSAYLAQRSWAKAQPALVERFARAYNRGVDFINTNEKEARALVPQYTRIDPDMAQKITLESFKKEVTMSAMEVTARMMLQHGLLDKMPNLEELVWRTAR